MEKNPKKNLMKSKEKSTESDFIESVSLQRYSITWIFHINMPQPRAAAAQGEDRSKATEDMLD